METTDRAFEVMGLASRLVLSAGLVCADPAPTVRVAAHLLHPFQLPEELMIRFRTAVVAFAAAALTLTLGAAPASAATAPSASTNCSAWAPLAKTGVSTRSCLTVAPATREVPPLVRNVLEVKNSAATSRKVDVNQVLTVQPSTGTTVSKATVATVKPGATYRSVIDDFAAAAHGRAYLRNGVNVQGPEKANLSVYRTKGF